MNKPLLSLFLILLWSLPGWAEVVKDAHTEAELVSEVTSIQPGQPFTVALRLKMDDHWHTYWKNPGDSGLATTLAWTLPPGFEASLIRWPHPQKFEVAGLISYAYEGEVYLLVDITPPSQVDEEEVSLKARADWLACQEACIPGGADLTLTLPVSDSFPQPSPAAQAIDATRLKLPIEGGGLKAGWQGDQIALYFEPPFEGEPYFFTSEPMTVNLTAPQVLSEAGSGNVLSLTVDKLAQEKPERLEGVLVLGQGPDSRALKVSVPVEATAPVAVIPAPGETQGLPAALFFAFLGGMILNLMPCVLPVLSLKVLGFVEQANEEGTKPILHGLVFSLGVILSFWAIAGALLALRATGEQVGWGFQLQNPLFVSALAILFLLIALNLFGVFEVGEGLTTLGDAAEGKSGFTGSFTSGVLATLVATPCTAPFMGSAVGFTLNQPALISLAVFTAVGVGMAFPYLVLTGSPALLKFVPRPGAWMEGFKQFLAFPMLLTAAWLCSVVGSQTDNEGVFPLLAALVAVALAGWVYGRWGSSLEVKPRRIGQAITVALLAFSLNLVAGIGKESGIQWEPYSPQLVTELQQSEEPFFIDFTADWCLSCKANERIALSSSKVIDRLQKLEVRTLKADWTDRNEEITQALARFGRNGVPLYVLYPGGGREPVVLPEVILPSTVLEALEQVDR